MWFCVLLANLLALPSKFQGRRSVLREKSDKKAPPSTTMIRRIPIERHKTEGVLGEFTR